MTGPVPTPTARESGIEGSGLGVIAATVLLVGGLILYANSLPSRALYEYGAQIQALNAADIELDSVVLAGRLDRSWNAESFAARLKAVSLRLAEIQAPPDLPNDPMQGRLHDKATELKELVTQKIRLSEVFAARDPTPGKAPIVPAGTQRPSPDPLAEQIASLPTKEICDELAALHRQAMEQAETIASRTGVLLATLTVPLGAWLIWSIASLMRTASTVRHSLDETGRQLAAERSARERLQLLSAAFDGAPEGMIITDRENRIVAVNPALLARTGFAAEELLGKRPEVLRSGRHDSNYYRQMWSQLNNQSLWRGEIWNRHKNGETVAEWLSITVVRDAHGNPANYVAIFSDVSELKESAARIHHLAHHDALTDLPNRLLLQDRLDQAILQSKRANRRTAVLFLDLDGFKAINDNLGHDLGDHLLIQVAERCAFVLRETDTISRQGGDEFVIVLPDLDQNQDAAQVARKLIRNLDRPFLIGNHELCVTGSIGIAMYPDDGQAASELLRNADDAMYRTKAEGRNGFQFYSSDMNAASLGDLLRENQLRGAIDENQLFLHYQPKVNARSGVAVGFEALLRWQHPQQGPLLPDQFLDVAEECGLGETIGGWVLNSVCRQLREWIDTGLGVLPVSINVSPQQFAQQNLADLTATALHNHRLPGNLLEFELTETILMRDIARAVRVLDRLRQMNVRLAIDDFGTGYSSLSYLKQFPVQTLKLDQSFVKDVGTGGEAVKVAAAIIALAHGMALQVVAEGVETGTQCRHLLDHGCDQFQGFLFSPPMPPDQARRWLRAPSGRQ